MLVINPNCVESHFSEKCWDVVEEMLASTKKPIADHKKGLRSMKTGYKMVVIWTVSLLLVLLFSIHVVMFVRNSFSTNSTATENCKGCQRTAYQRSRLNPTGLKEYLKWFQEILIATGLKE